MPWVCCSTSVAAWSTAAGEAWLWIVRWAVAVCCEVLALQMCRSWTAATPSTASRSARTCSASTPRGTASIASSTLSRSRSQVPQAITSEISTLTAGSTRFQPVSPITMPATTTPADTAASAAMCRNAPRMLASLLRPAASQTAVIVLIATPIAATTIMVTPCTGGGSTSRWAASQRITPQATSSRAAFANAAKIVDRPRPQVNRFDGGLRASQCAPHANSSPSTSPALWPASEISASESAANPNTSSTTTNTTFSTTPTPIARSICCDGPATPWACP